MESRQLIILLIFSFIFQLSIAQEVKWGTPVTPKEANGDVVSLGWHDGFLYNLQIGAVWTNVGLAKVAKNNIRLQKISKDAEVIFTKDLSREGVEDIDSYTQFTALIKDGAIIIFYMVEKRGNNELKSVTYDLEGNLKKNGTVYSYQKEACFSKLYEHNYRMDINNFSFSISPNDLKIGVTSVCLVGSKEFEITTVVLNTDGSEPKVHKKSFSTEGIIYKFINRQLAIDDYGNVVYNYDIQERRPERYTRKILVTSNDDNVLAHKEMGNDDGSLYYDDIFIKFSDKNEAFMVGVAKVSEFDKSVFFTKLDLLEADKLKIHPYLKNHEMYNAFAKYRDYFYFDIVFGKNGNGFLVINIMHKQSGGLSKNNGLLVSPFDKEAKLGSITLVPKLHDLYIEQYPSCIKNGKLYLLYDNHAYNINVDKVEQMKKPYVGRSATYLATVSSDNLVTRKILFTEKEIKGDLHTIKTQETDSGFIINVTDDRKVRYGKVDF